MHLRHITRSHDIYRKAGAHVALHVFTFDAEAFEYILEALACEMLSETALRMLVQPSSQTDHLINITSIGVHECLMRGEKWSEISLARPSKFELTLYIFAPQLISNSHETRAQQILASPFALVLAPRVSAR